LEGLESNGETQENYPESAGATGAARRQPERPSIVHSSLYLPEPVYEALRKVAFDERLKIHDVVLEGIDLACPTSGRPANVCYASDRYRNDEPLKATRGPIARTALSR
jgi:hypothetical protein